MNIGLMVYEPLRDQSGGYFYDRKMVNYLKECGHDVLVYTFPFEVERVINDDVELLIEDELCHEDLCAFNLKLKKAFPIPIIALVHHLKYLEPISQPENIKEKEKEFLRTCDGVITNSASTSQEVKELGVKRATLISYPGCDHLVPPADFQRVTPQQFLNLLSIGILVPRKGFHLLLEALEELSDHPWRLRIVGDETLDLRYVESLRTKARGLGDRVQFFGTVSAKKLSRFYVDSDLFILPSYFEGYGMVVAEAILHLLPVIASRIGGIPEIIRDGREGVLIPPGDKFALKQALRYFMEYPMHLDPFIKACALRRSTLPTWKETGRRIESFLFRFRHGSFKA